MSSINIFQSKPWADVTRHSNSTSKTFQDDYEWVTEQLVKVANSCCNGRVISVLEGGYKIHGGIVSPFARSVAAHVRGLVDGGSSRELYDKQDEDWESQFERHMVEEKERKRQLKMERFSRPPVDMAVHHNHNLRDHDALDPSAPAHHQVHDAAADIVAAGAIGTGLTPLHAGGAELEHSQDDTEGEGVAGGMEALMQDPSAEAVGVGEEEGPARKRRRNQVDYKELYEQMKKEEGESK